MRAGSRFMSPMKRATNSSRGRMVDLARAAHLDDPAVIHHGDLVANFQRLGLVVRHVDRRQSEPVHQRPQFRPQPDLQLVVQVAQGLVHQQHPGSQGECARQRNALLLPAAEGRYRPFIHASQSQEQQDLFDTCPDGIARSNFCTPWRNGNAIFS